MSRFGLLMSLTLWAVVEQVAASDLFSDPVIMASLSIPLAGHSSRMHKPQFGLSVSRRAVHDRFGDDSTRHKLVEFTAPLEDPTSVSLNGVPLWASSLRQDANSVDRELTTEEKVGTVAIVGLALASATGVVIIVNN